MIFDSACLFNSRLRQICTNIVQPLVARAWPRSSGSCRIGLELWMRCPLITAAKPEDSDAKFWRGPPILADSKSLLDTEL